VKTEEVNVDGFRYRVTQLTGFAGFRMSNRILHLLVDALPAVAKLVNQGKGLRELLGTTDVEALLPAAGSIINKLSADDQESLTRELLEPVVVVLNGKQEPVLDIFDTHFQGRIASVYKLVFAAIRVNFGNFGVGRGSAGTSPQSQTPSVSDKSATSAGQPSASS
jgi:hypothetical protein